MAQGPVLTQRIKNLIAGIHVNHPDYGPTRLHVELLKQMKEKELDRNYGPDWPGVGAVGKVLFEIRDKGNKQVTDSKDKLWTVLSLTDNPIQPEVLPTVLRLQAIMLKEQNPLTIREALWISRLYYVFKNVTLHDESGRVTNVEKELLLLEAKQYALEERKLRILADKFPDKEETEKWLQLYGDAILNYFATGDLETVKTTAKELISRNILTEKEFAQWLTLTQQTRKKGGKK